MCYRSSHHGFRVTLLLPLSTRNLATTCRHLAALSLTFFCPVNDCPLYDGLPVNDIEFRISTLQSYYYYFFIYIVILKNNLFQLLPKVLKFSGTLVSKRSPEVIDMV